MGGCLSSSNSYDGHSQASNLSGQLLEAARNNDFDQVAFLLAIGADVNAIGSEGATALLLRAANIGHSACLDLLLKNGADVNSSDSEGGTALMAAASEGHADYVDLLLKNGADVNAADSEGQTALIWAAYRVHSDSLDLLLKNGADVNAANSKGGTALICAAYSGHSACIDLLLKHGADVNAADNTGWTALILAAEEGHSACIDLLLKNGADVNAANSDGWTALIRAAEWGHGDCLDRLLKNGADVNAADSKGYTALMGAALKGHADCVDLLIQKGADVNVVDDGGNSALAFAAKEGKVECLKLLLNHHGATIKDLANLEEAMDVATTAETRRILRRHIKNFELEHTTQIATESFAPPPPPVPSPLDFSALNSAGSSMPSPSAPFMTIPPSMPSAPQNRGGGDISHQHWVIPFEELQLGSLLGKGSYAEVYLATWHGTEVAAKRFTFPGGSAESEAEFSTALLNKITIEADLLASIRHPHVVAFLAMCSKPPCMVTELCSQGSVFDMMKRCKNDPNLANNLTWRRRLNMLTWV